MFILMQVMVLQAPNSKHSDTPSTTPCIDIPVQLSAIILYHEISYCNMSNIVNVTHHYNV